MKSSSRYFMFLCFVLTLVMLAACSNNENEKVNEITLKEKDQLSTIKYETFKNALSIDILKNFTPDGFTLNGNSVEMRDITIIDPELSFNKRQHITVDGTATEDSTQQAFYYDNKDKSIQLLLTIVYTNKDLGNDILQYQVNSGYEGFNETLGSKSDMIILSYKNLIVGMHQTATNKVDLDITQSATKKLIKKLKKY
jgi:hypothetical protein